MSKNKEKFPSSPNTLHNYFARSPASTKKPANPSTPTSALAADGRLSSNNQAGGTPKSSKPTVKKESESIGKEKRTVAVKPSVEDENEDEVGTKKKRRRILMLDDSDNEDGGAADGQNNENKPNNNNNNLEDHDEQTGTKRFALLSSYERPTEQTESTDEPKGASKQESNDGPAQKKIKLENIIESNDEPGSVLDEPTVWTHQKLDFLKPNKIKDIHGNRPGSEKYDSRTLYVPDSYLGTLTPAMRQWWILKSKNYDCVLFFKVGKFYELYHMDAEVGVTELGFSFMKGEFAH
uniref:DNA mismatch repair protein MutS-like N-terminal domain-containing protein n=1 Tax=Anopheles maculatus TaxID=74869 RepID=A0A182T8C0_9DIPT